MTSLVSVLVPCFNAERFLGATLESVLGQTWPNLEVIVVDDESSDRSAEIAESFVGRGVHLVRQAHGGVCRARNRAFAESTGDFIQFLDADDLIDPDKIELQMARLAKEPRSVATAEFGRFWKSPDETVFAPQPNWEDLDPVEWLVRARGEDGMGMYIPAMWMLPRAVVEASGPWNESLSSSGYDDIEYFTRAVLAAERVLFCEGARCRYRSGIAGSLSKSVIWPLKVVAIGLCEAHVRDRRDSDDVRRAFALAWQNLAQWAYPYDPTVARLALTRARATHPMKFSPRGGPRFRLLCRLFGWRVARRLQITSGGF